jgi:hypothetical protein
VADPRVFGLTYELRPLQPLCEPALQTFVSWVIEWTDAIMGTLWPVSGGGVFPWRIVGLLARRHDNLGRPSRQFLGLSTLWPPCQVEIV